MSDEPEVAGLLALMLLHHARRASRTGPGGRLVPDARSAGETDWVQIVEWYDELLLLTGSPVVRLNRAVAVGEADGPQAGLAALADVNPDLPRYAAVTAYLHERAGDLEHAVELYADASCTATSVPERDHLTREAARVRQLLRLSLHRSEQPPWLGPRHSPRRALR